MIRTIGKKIKLNKYIEVEENITEEKVISIFIKPESKTMDITLALSNENKDVLAENIINLTGSDYDLLFSDNIIFGEGKQEGSYRENDLWKMIDKSGVN